MIKEPQTMQQIAADRPLSEPCSDRPGAVTQGGTAAAAVRVATVVLSANKQVFVDDGNSTSWATVALAYPYMPRTGDSVLLAADQQSDYIIGVLQCAEQMVLSASGDITIESHGEIKLKARQGVSINTPEIAMRATSMTIVVESLVQKFNNVKTTVKENIDLRAKQLRQRFAGSYFLKAKQIDEKAEKAVNIDGEKINLG